MKYDLPIHPEEATKKLFTVLPKSTKDILEQRFGLGKNPNRMTLEAIGQKYGITRERVRQIEADGFNRIKKSAKPVAEPQLFEIISSFAKNAGALSFANQAVLANWLMLSKMIAKNYFDQWGLIEFPEIKPRGVRDLSHMVLSRYGKPLHFSAVASGIGKLIGKPVHTQTVHNELIKDNRFVLVGRGLYALKNWGYTAGVVKDVISDVLEKSGPMAKEKVIAAVLKQRFVKPNTVFINLENKKYFKKLADGKYSLK